MAKIFLDNNDFATVSESHRVFGSTGSNDRVLIQNTAKGSTVNANVETLQFVGKFTDYTFAIVGNQLQIGYQGSVLATVGIQDDSNGTQLTFSDVTTAVNVTGMNQATIGKAVLTTSLTSYTNAQLDGALPVSSGDKAPWTLVMRTGDYYNGKTFVSDGTAVGTSITTAPRYADYPYKSSSDGNEVYWSSYNYNNDITPRFWSLVSGSTEPVQLLNSYVNTTTSYTMASGYTLIEGYYNPAKQLIATDGTAAHTYTLDGIDFILQVNTTNNTIWHTMNTTPYGTELYKTVLTDSGFTTSMVKDIYAGSSSAFGNYQSNSGVFLPNGKIVFSANDGIHGGSPWVTDGTETGTLLLQDTNNGNSAILDASQFTEVNGKAVYKVYHDGWELGVTDGTTAGTNVLEIYSGYGDSNPTIIGTINDKLYFTATDATGLGLFSTDGNTFSKLVSVSDSNAQILGYTANKAYFALTTTAIGKELWSVDLTAVTPTIALVKDILTGSGSGLTGTLNNQMIGDKILFNAYTSGTNQGLFISDGSSSGTVQLASSFTDKAIIGNKVFFANSSGVSVSDVSATTVSATQVVAGDFTTQVNYSLPDRLQSDADQAFYLTADNKLKVATTATDSIQLADHVSKFKVVAENALYFIETNSSNVASLWYSDGTASGTRYIEDLSSSASSYDMENAVAIHTVGVAG